MEETLNINDFDILGLITLRDIKGLEKYVTPIVEGNQVMFQRYLSRSKEYYNVKTMSELSEEREKLKRLLDRRPTKRNFVILENMLNCSGKVYFKKMEQYIKSRTIQKEEEMSRARECMEEDLRNIITILSKKGLINVRESNILPGGFENSERRLIEMDNKAMLYLFADSLNFLKDNENIETLTPGYGSLYIGPTLKVMYGWDYTNLLKSKYIKSTMPDTEKTDMIELVSTDRVFGEGKEVLLLDDNIGTGQTMEEIKNQLHNNGIDKVISGAIQYNWINYYRIGIGEKRLDKKGNKIQRFKAQNYDIISPMNYYGHKLCERAISMLHSSGEEYIAYLNSKSYRLPVYSDLIGSIERGMQFAEMSGLRLSDKYDYKKRRERYPQELLDEYKDPQSLNDAQKAITEDIIKTITDYTKDKETIHVRE